MALLAGFLGEFACRDGIYLISEPRRYQGPEEAYDGQYAIDRIQLDTFRHEGAALLALCAEYGFRSSHPVLEIGCGTGRLSLSLVLSGRIEELLLTDASPAFCSITARKLSAMSAPGTEISLATLRWEDLDRLPAGTFSMVILRSVLHHVAEIPAFFQGCGRILRPGGLLVFEEPCYEGYLLMGAMTQFVPDLLRAKGVALDPKHAHDIQVFVEGMRFYARRDVDKSLAEDKHLFRPDELMRLSQSNGMEMHLFPNRTFFDIDKRAEPLPAGYFEKFYFDYLKYSMSWDEELLGLFDAHVRGYLGYFSCLAANNALPYTYGTFLCRKRDDAGPSAAGGSGPTL
jgi:ubiquinone/menaquinone biosynthesis C-methylase UbiE